METEERIKAALDTEITSRIANGARAAARSTRRMSQLEAEREKLLQAYYVSAIPIELLKKEQSRIDGEVAVLRQKSSVDRTHVAGAGDVLGRALKRLRSCHKSYLAAEGSVRRLWNRALFKAVNMGSGQVTRFEYREPFDSLFRWAGSNTD